MKLASLWKINPFCSECKKPEKALLNTRTVQIHSVLSQREKARHNSGHEWKWVEFSENYNLALILKILPPLVGVKLFDLLCNSGTSDCVGVFDIYLTYARWTAPDITVPQFPHSLSRKWKEMVSAAPGDSGSFPMCLIFSSLLFLKIIFVILKKKKILENL